MSHRILASVADMAAHADTDLHEIVPDAPDWETRSTAHPAASGPMLSFAIAESRLQTTTLTDCTVLGGHFPVIDGAALFSFMHHNGDNQVARYADGDASVGVTLNAASERALTKAVPLPEGPEYFLLGGRSNNIWHFLYNFALRLAVVRQRYGSVAASPYTFLVPKGLKPDLYAFLAMLGVTADRRLDYDGIKPLAVPRLTVTATPFCFDAAQLYGSKFACRTAGFAPEAAPWDTPADGDKVYLSRSDAIWRRVLNEDALIPDLQARGFRCLRLTDLAPADLAATMQAASIVIGASGANLAATFFCRPGTTIVEMSHTPMIRKYYFQLTSSAHGFDHHKVVCEAAQTDENYHKWDFTVPVGSLTGWLDERLS